MKRFILIIMVIALVFLGYYHSTDSAQPSVEANVEPSKPVKVDIHGILRPDENGTWCLLTEGNHSSTGIRSVSQTAEHIVVVFDEPLSELYTAVVDEDETLSVAGYNCGTSLSRVDARIFCGRNGESVSPSEITVQGANLWVHVSGLR